MILLNHPKKKKYILDNVRDIKAIYSLRKQKANQLYACRVRDDTNSEQDIGFIGQNLDVSGMLAWSQRNLVSSIPLGVDGNSDGISDGWTTYTNGTSSYHVSNNEQEIRITGSTLNTEKSVVQKTINCVVGNILTVSVTERIISNARIKTVLDWYNGSTYISSNSSSYTTNTTDATLSISATAPTNTTKCTISFGTYPVNNGNTGSAYFKDASVTISNQSIYIAKLYDPAGLNDAIQSTASYQPRIVNAGIVDRDFDANKCAIMWPTFASASGVNIISNGNFSNGTTGFMGISGTLSAANNTLSVLGDGGGLGPYASQNTAIACSVGKRYYMSVKVRITNVDAPKLQLQGRGTTSGTLITVKEQLSPTMNQWYTLTGIFTVTTAHVGNIKVIVRSEYADASTANGKVLEVQEVVCIDVTDLDTPSIYFDGSNDVLTIPTYPSVSQASVLYPTFSSASGVTLVSNGDFSNGTTGFSGVDATLSDSNNTLSVTGNGVSNIPRVYQNTNTSCAVGRRYFVRATVRVTNSSSSNIKLEFDGVTAGTIVIASQQNTPTVNQWYTLNGVVAVGSDFTGNIQVKITHTYADAATANGKVLEIQEVVCIDVTNLWNIEITGQPLMLNAVFNNANQAGYFFSKNGQNSSEMQYGVLYDNTTQKSQLQLEGGGRQNLADGSLPINTQKVYSATFSSGAQQESVNGTALGTAGNYNSTLTPRANMQIGARSNNAGGTAWADFFKGYMSEIIISRNPSTRNKIELSQGKYYQQTISG